MIRLTIVEREGRPGVLAKGAKNEIGLPALWLRERAQDESQVDRVTGQRLVNPHLLPPDLALVEARWVDDRLQLSFSDGYRGTYDAAPLIAALDFDDGCPPPLPWTAAEAPDTRYPWAAVQDSDEVLLEALDDFLSWGFLVLTDTPKKPDAILEIAACFGQVRETNFGRRFEVSSRPASNDLAYRPVALAPHTDNPYREPVPGIQVLHCLVDETSGGLSTLADSLAAAELLKEEDADGFELLASLPVRYRFRDDGAHLVAIRPVIETDGEGRMTGVHYSPRLDELPLLPEAELQRYQAARKRLAELFADERFELRFRLEAGEFLMLDNNRILHGRTAFDPGEGRRHFTGCYMDRDGPKSRYRVLSARFAEAA